MLAIAPRRSSFTSTPLLVLVALLAAQLALVVPAPPRQPPAAALAPPLGQGQQVAPGEVPAGVDAASWAQITAQIAAGPYRAYPAGEGYASANPAHGWQIRYGADGTTALRPREPGAAPWRWGMRLAGYGFAALVAPPPAPQALLPEGQRLTYRWDAAVDEWWQNGTAGLEQGFTVRRPPAGGRAGEPLRVALALSGDLRAAPMPGGLAFHDPAGATAFTYTKLRSWDATGRDLPSSMALHGELIELTVDLAGAVYPVTIDPLVQQGYLKASNTGGADTFGNSVAVSGNTMVVGAPGEDSNATGVNGNGADNSAVDSGAAYVFTRTGSTWSQQAYLKASNTGAGDFFGYTVAIYDNTVLVGAYGEDSSATTVNGNGTNNSALSAGAAYVFTRTGTAWSQQAYLKASNAEAGDSFGNEVAIRGDTVVVGAYLEDSSATTVNGSQGNNGAVDSGAAYVFVRNSGVWSQQAYLKASNTGANDSFGFATAIFDNTILIGAAFENSNATGVNGNGANNSAVDSGAAYVFTRSGTSWSQQAYLKASNTDSNDRFGWAVAVSGDTAVVGAIQEDSSATGVNGTQGNNSASNSGAAYVFARTGSSWSQQAYLKASNTGDGDVFGYSVDVVGDTVVVGAQGEDSSATGLNGNQADNSAADAGAAYVFTRSAGVWSQRDYLKASNTGAGDEFGQWVAAANGMVVVGAPSESSGATGVDGNQADSSAGGAGAVYALNDPVLPTPVTLAELRAVAGAEGVEVRWGTASEVAVAGFRILRGPQARREEATALSELIPASGDSLTGASYAWVDRAPLEGADYWLQVVNSDGTTEEYGPVRPEPPAVRGASRVYLPFVRR